MKLLLNSDAIFWAAVLPEKLSSAARAAIASPDNELYASDVTWWEFVIKEAIGKLSFGTSQRDFAARQMDAFQLRSLEIRRDHIFAVGELPGHHDDPFDRLLVAQAIVEGLPIVTSDGKIARYAVETIW